MPRKLKLLSSLESEEQIRIMKLINNGELKLMNVSSPKADKGVLWIEDEIETLVMLDFPQTEDDESDFDDEVLDLMEDSYEDDEDDD